MLNIGKAAVLGAGAMGAVIFGYFASCLASTVSESNKVFWKDEMKV